MDSGILTNVNRSHSQMAEVIANNQFVANVCCKMNWSSNNHLVHSYILFILEPSLPITTMVRLLFSYISVHEWIRKTPGNYYSYQSVVGEHSCRLSLCANLSLMK